MRKAIFLFLIIILLALSACSSGEQTINVQGSSELEVEPDEAEVWAGYSVVKDSAEEAQNDVNGVVSAIIESLEAEGFDDIETERLNLYEERTWKEGEYETQGWRASQTLKVSTADIDNAGKIIDIMVENGANQISNINFGLSEPKEKEYKKQALAEATTNAREKAEVIAESLDVRLGDIKTVSESSFHYMPYRYGMAEVAVDEAVEQAAKVMPSDVTVTTSISLVYNTK